LVGSTIHHYVGGYSVFVWVMLLLLILCIALSSGSLPGLRSGARSAVSSQ
jgi:hypothetical protein